MNDAPLHFTFAVLTFVTMTFVAGREAYWILSHRIVATRHGFFTSLCVLLIATGNLIEAIGHQRENESVDITGALVVQAGLLLLGVFLVLLHPQLRQIAERRPRCPH